MTRKPKCSYFRKNVENKQYDLDLNVSENRWWRLGDPIEVLTVAELDLKR